MNIAIYASGGIGRKRLVKDGFESLDDAEEYAFHNYPILYLDRDADHAHCADAFASDGTVYAIEPKEGRS